MLAAESATLLLVSAGLGDRGSQLASEKISSALKYIYLQELLYQPAVTMPKYSALLFYVRVFGFRGNSGLFRANILAAAGLVTAWLLFALSFDVFRCTSVRKPWLPITPGHCVNVSPWLVAILAVSVIIDVYIMILPIPVLWSLPVGRKNKMILTGFFFCACW